MLAMKVFELLGVLVAISIASSWSLIIPCQALITPRRSRRSVRRSSALVKLEVMPPFEGEFQQEEEDNTEVEKKVERPTLTEIEVHGPDVEPQKPKIVVLGASGRIGRYVTISRSIKQV